MWRQWQWQLMLRCSVSDGSTGRDEGSDEACKWSGRALESS